MQGNQETLTALLRIADKPKCWFPVSDVNSPDKNCLLMELHGGMLVVRAANNDLGEDRPEAALEKLLAALRITRQLCSQAHSTEYTAGWAVGRSVMESITWVVANYHVPDAWLAKFETEIDAIEHGRRERLREYSRVRGLTMRKHGRIGPRLRQMLIDLIPGRADAGLAGSQKTLAKLRGARIVFALRRHKDGTGDWPRSLSEIQGGLPRDALVDPLSGQPFIYRQDRGSFLLYGPGPNGLDDGRRGDDCRVWPQ
jgi:hypothetical protein